MILGGGQEPSSMGHHMGLSHQGSLVLSSTLNANAAVGEEAHHHHHLTGHELSAPVFKNPSDAGRLPNIMSP